MKRAIKFLTLGLLIALLASPLVAQEKKKRQAKGERKGAGAQVFQFPKEITLTEEQTKQLKAIQEEFGPKVDEINKRRAAILNEEQKAARAAAAKANRDAGKKGKEAQEAINAAMKLTPEQKTKMDAVEKDFRELNAKIQEKKLGILTAEQKAKLPKRAQAKKKAGK